MTGKTARAHGFEAVLVCFIILKVAGVVDWGWAWVLSPLWVGAAVSVSGTLLVALIKKVRGQPLGKCSCGATYTKKQWLKLPYVGRKRFSADEDGPAITFELRNCPCKSTITAGVPSESVRE